MYRISPTPFDKLASDGGYGGIRISSNHLSLTATGDGTKGADGYANNGDLNIQGSNVSAKVVDLNAARDVNLTSATNTNTETSSNSSSGWAVGANIGVSASGSMGISVFANANKGKGNANGNGVTHTETQINATDTLNVNSGIRFLNNPEMLNDMLSPYTKYFPNARSGEKYDFKSQYPEKGDVAYNRFVIFNNVVTPTIYATARDIGNFSAGAAAGVNNWSWIKTRSFFDGYNAISRHGKQWSESPVSQSAERAGWEYGRTQQKNK